MFGSSNTPFGAPNTNNTPFGSSNTGGGGFGAPAPAAPFGTGGGAFGAPAPAGFGAPAAPAFGGGGATAFGAPTAFGNNPAPARPTTNVFGGAPATTTNVFGGAPATPFGSPPAAAPTGGLFGAPAPAPAGGMFGAPAPAPTGGLFGNTNPTTTTTSAFGAPAPAPGGFSGFGATSSTTNPAFGAQPAPAFGSPPAPAPGLFGSPPAPASAFGAPATSIFGAPAPAPSGGMFGAPAPATGGLFGAPAAAPTGGTGGTKIAPFQPGTKSDAGSTVTFMSLSGMPQYEHKNFEELRVEDYQQGTRNSGAAATAAPTASTFSGFGAPAPAASTGFGQTTSAFGATPAAPASTGFGAPAPAFGGFGGAPAAAAPTAFGAAPASGGLFGAPAPAPGGFGGFGVATKPPAPGGLFGAPTPAPAPTMFGSTPAPAAGGLFGAPKPAPAPGLFGAPAPTPAGGLFGTPAPAPGALFGAPAPAPNTGGLFGAPAPAGGGLFGTPAPAPAFGAAPAPGGFGAAPAPGTSSLFGPKPAGGLFGAPAPAPGLFGAPAPAPTTAFGAPAAPQAQGGSPGMGMSWGNIIPPAEDAVLAQKLAAVDNQKKELERTEVWRGRSPQESSVTPKSNGDLGLHASPYSASSVGLVSYRASPRSMVNIRPRGFGFMSKSPATPDVRNLGRSIPSPMKSPDAYLGSAHKHLIIKPDAHKPRPSIRLEMTDVPQIAAGETAESREDVIRAPAKTPPLRLTRPSPPTMASPLGIASPPAAAMEEEAPTPQSDRQSGSTEKGHSAGGTDSSYDFYQQILASPPAGSSATKSGSPAEKTAGDVLPKLTKTGYTVSPPLDEMSKMSEADLATVTGFTVTRAGYASVAWDGAVDVRGVDLDTIVCIESGDVAVYDAEEANGTKPPEGQKLNRPAVITMENMLPVGGLDADEDTKDRYERKIKKLTINKLKAEFLLYDKSTGVWSFRVPHFSRYRFEDDSSEDEEEARTSSSLQGPTNFGSGERGGRSLDLKTGTGKKSVRFREYVEVEKMDGYSVALVSDTDMGDSETRVRDAATNAYTEMFEVAEDEESLPSSPESPMPFAPSADSIFEDECVSYDYVPPDPLPLVSSRLVTPSEKGITSRVAQKCGIREPTDSGTDFGLRLGRSFRVGWRPDGSFLRIDPSPIGNAVDLHQARPGFSGHEKGIGALLPLLKTNLRHSIAPTNPSLFSFPSDTVLDILSDIEASACEILSSHGDPEQPVIIRRAFSLLLCLVKKEIFADSHSSEVSISTMEAENFTQTLLAKQSGVDACRKWLIETCREDVRVDIQNAVRINDAHSAIFAALSGGDVEQAVSIAINHGHFQLAAVMSAGPDGFSSVYDQVQQWRETGASRYIPSELIRIYTLLGGDMSLEEEAFARGESSLDWRRRLCMLISYSGSREMCLSSFMEKYDMDVSRGIAPYPAPRHMNTASPTADGSKCVLYRILDLVRLSGPDRDLCLTVSPIGISPSKSDFAGTFHLAAAISAIGCCPPISPYEEATVVDSYATQLSNDGMWEWGVYVLLFTFGTETAQRGHTRRSRQQQAKQMIIRNYPSSADSSVRSKRAFLEERVKVPSEWFEEALVYHCAHSGDVKGYVQHLAAVSLDQAREALEELVIPNMLFQGTSEIQESMELLEPFAATDDSSLAAATMDFFVLSQDVVTFTRDHVPVEAPQQWLELANRIEKRFVSYRSQLEKCSSRSRWPRVYPSYRIVPQEMFLAEALAGISFLKLQLEALLSGASVLEKDGVQFKVASQLAFLGKGGAQQNMVTSTATNESILRGMI